MKKIIGAVMCLFAVNVNAVTVYSGGNFTMLDATGNTTGGTNDVSWSFDDTLINTSNSGTAFNGDFTSNQPFFGFNWNAHDVRVFGEGSYTFDTTCTAVQIQSGVTECNNALMTGQTSQFVTIDVGPGQLGVHMLWYWNKTDDIDIAIVWNQDSLWADADGNLNSVNNLFAGAAGIAPDPLMNWQLVSTDADSDGFNGMKMVDGAFQGFSANYSFNTVVPVPPAVWLFGSGLIGLLGLARRNNQC